MSTAQPSKSAIFRAFVWPTIVALVVVAVITIERLQVDWTAACSLQAENPGSCTEENFNMVFAWVPAAFAFGLAHIVGATGLHNGSNTSAAITERLGKLVAYFAIHVFPAFGWYFFYVGLAAGFLISLTVVGLIIAFPVGALAAGFVAGLLLALAAGPSFTVLDRAGWKRLLLDYGSGSAVGTLVLISGQGLFDPAFGFIAGPDRPWFTATGALSAVALSCILLWVAALKANYPSIRVLGNQDFRSAVAAIGLAAAALVLPVHFMVRNSATVFPRNGGFLAPVASYIRGNKPPVTSTLALAGLPYAGPRSAIIEREIISRDRMETTTLHKGTDQEVNVGSTVYDSYVQWRITPLLEPKRESIYVIADAGGAQSELHCKPVSGERQRCLRYPDPPVPPDLTEETRPLAEDGEDGYEFSSVAKDAALGIRYVTTTRVEGSSEIDWARLYCRLNLVNVTIAKFSVHQIIPCDADWPAEATRVRAYVEGLFAPATANSSSLNTVGEK
jgi:hypothetical protein